MTNYRQEMEQATSLYRPQTNTPYESNERTKLFQNSMVVMWQTMAKLFHPQWTKNNGEIGGQVFRDWTIELERFGSAGVLRGIESVRLSGNSYAPNLNKYIGHCLESNGGGNVGVGESYSEQLQGGRLKPTANGVPLCWTVGSYTHDQLLASPCHEDHAMAEQMGGAGWTHGSLQ